VFKKNIDSQIESHPTVITCKKRARALRKSLAENGQKQTLMQCQTLAAQELGYQDWFDLHNQIKLQIIAKKEDNYEDSLSMHYFNMIIEDAIKESATDIHFTVNAQHCDITMRKHGEIMIYKAPLLRKEADDLLSLAYNILSGDSKIIVFNPREIQSVVLEHETASYKVRILYNSLPIYPEGYTVVMKITQIEDLKTKHIHGNHIGSLTQLGFSQSHEAMIDRIMENRRGSLFFTGPTGVGKSTTIMTTLRNFNAKTRYTKRIASIEEVVEKLVPGITQIPVPWVTGKDVSQQVMDKAIINQVLRSDNDVIYLDDNVARRNMDDMIEMIRESFVISQVHASSALSAIRRFHHIGWSYEMMAQKDFLSGLAHQSLLHTLCPHCSVSFVQRVKEKDDLKDVMALTALQEHYPQYKKYFSQIRVRGQGCDHCQNMGINGRTACAEVIVIDDEMRELIAKAEFIALEQYWKSTSDGNILSDNMQGKTSLEHALQKMFNGLIDIHDVREWFADFIDNRR
jgi:general secretion pathway protein E